MLTFRLLKIGIPVLIIGLMVHLLLASRLSLRLYLHFVFLLYVSNCVNVEAPNPFGEPISTMSALVSKALGDDISIANDREALGEVLPAAFFDNPRIDPIEACWSGRIFVRSAYEVWAVIRFSVCVNQLLYDCDPELPFWMAEQSSRLPPSRGDILLAWILVDSPYYYPTHPFTSCTENDWKATKEAWRTMLAAPNPIYRLVALRNVPYFSSSDEETLHAYTNALNERSTLFQYTAIQGILATKLPSGVDLIRRFLEKDDVVPNDGTLLELEHTLDVREEARKVLIELESIEQGAGADNPLDRT